MHFSYVTFATLRSIYLTTHSIFKESRIHVTLDVKIAR